MRAEKALDDLEVKDDYAIGVEQAPEGGSAALMIEHGSLNEGLHQPSPDSSTAQSLGLGPATG